MAQDPGRCFWFGTEDWMQWFPTPLQGADMSPEGWASGGSLLNGGGWQLNSVGSHKTYTFEWRSSSSREVAQLMKSYADGTYGRGLIYFLDPLTYDQNILPARVAAPSMAVDNEGASMVYGLEPTGAITSGWQTNLLPISGAYYDLAGVPEGFRGKEDAVFVPIPQGYTLFLGAFYSATGDGGIFATAQNTNGTIGSTTTLTPQTPADTSVVSNTFSGVSGVWVWLGRDGSSASTVTVQALIGRLLPSEQVGTPREDMIVRGPWTGGMGHSGVRFVGKPTYTANSPINGGRIGFAASFREVGSWLYG